MKKIDIVFCLLTYKNSEDLESFIKSLKLIKNNFSYQLIIVDNFYNVEITNRIKEISMANKCEFISINNKGYGYGNNVGINYAIDKYKFEYLVVCNPDTLIVEFDIESLRGQEENIIAPEILTLNNKKQNPLNFKYMPISERIVYKGFKKNNRLLLYCGIGINKINRFFNNFLLSLKKSKREVVYSAHGSFIIFSKFSLTRLKPVFDDKIFLFCEESDLAQKVKKNQLKIVLNKDIVIKHKEDGSMNLSSKDLTGIHKNSYVYYYEKWIKSI